jgi:hypothetical protein
MTSWNLTPEQQKLHNLWERHLIQPEAVVILAAFAIRTPRLLLNSVTSRFPGGLANSSGTVGQYLTVHITTPTYALFNEDTEPYNGVTGGSFSSQDGYRRTALGRIAVVIAMIECIECFGNSCQRLGSAELVAKKAGVHLANPVADKSHHVN